MEQGQRALLRAGTVIPAHPLALTAERRLDERRQRALTRYYLAAGVGGVAVGVHTTQFAIRQAGLYEPVLRLAAEEIEAARLARPVLKVAGVCGPTPQAVEEAALARELGYDLALISPGGLPGYSEEQLLDRARAVGRVLPLFGFYLQPAVGGRLLSYAFWRALADLPALAAVKIAPFDRYRTLEVVRAVAEAGRGADVALYTGNDDNIIADLLTVYRVPTVSGTVTLRMVGGLLGHWAIWTRKAVEYFKAIQTAVAGGGGSSGLLTLGAQVTEMNAAVFDVVNNFRGSIAGIHAVLQRQGLLAGTWCLEPAETLSPGQMNAIAEVIGRYPELTDDDFVRSHLAEWLS